MLGYISFFYFFFIYIIHLAVDGWMDVYTPYFWGYIGALRVHFGVNIHYTIIPYCQYIIVVASMMLVWEYGSINHKV